MHRPVLGGAGGPITLCHQAEHDPATQLLDNAPMERLIQLFESDWMPGRRYDLITAARRDARVYLMGYYDSVRRHKNLKGKTPGEAENTLNSLSKIT